MDLTKLRHAIQAALTPDLLKPVQRRLLTGIHPTEGHCAVAAEAAYHILGGRARGWVPMVLPKHVLGNNTHWWIENRITGERFDPTAEQWGSAPIPYHLGKGCGFMAPNGRPGRRARIVIERVSGIL